MANQKPQAKPKVIDTNDEVAVAVAEQEAEAELPAQGHARREALKQREENLSHEAEQVAAQIMAGTVDATQMEMINEIQQRSKLLNVSGKQPGYVYGWVSKNSHGQHIERMKGYGWVMAQGDDPEALELKGSGRYTQNLGSPGTTRELADVILMRIPYDRYVVLRAMEIAHTKRVQQASAANLTALADQHRDNVKIYPYKMEDPHGNLSGPDIRSRRFTGKQNAQAMTAHIKGGSVPGFEISQR